MNSQALEAQSVTSARLVATDGKTFPLRSAHLGARVEGGFAHSTLTQSFHNPHDETLEVTFEEGSVDVIATDDGDFRFRAGFDRATAASLPAGTIVRNVVAPDHLVLSAPWEGPSQVAMLELERDLYNYAVHFSMRVE